MMSDIIPSFARSRKGLCGSFIDGEGAFLWWPNMRALGWFDKNDATLYRASRAQDVTGRTASLHGSWYAESEQECLSIGLSHGAKRKRARSHDRRRRRKAK